MKNIDILQGCSFSSCMSGLRAFIWFVSALVSSMSYATVVLHDDFNDGILDGTKWRTDTTLERSAVVEVSPEGYVESINRGHLNTSGEWNPGKSEVGTVSITGRFRLPSEGSADGDKLNVATRSSGLIRDPQAGGNCQECIEFGLVRYDFGFGTIMWLDLHLAPDQDITLAYKPFTVGEDWYWFKMEDDGYNIRVWVDLLGDFLRAPDLEATSDYVSTANHVSFYGRPFEVGSDHVTQFDDITITVPEPSSILLFLIGCMGLTVSRYTIIARKAGAWA
jgi:hypothetical protein